MIVEGEPVLDFNEARSVICPLRFFIISILIAVAVLSDIDYKLIKLKYLPSYINYT